MEANANIKTPLGRRVTPPSTPSASAVLEQARIEGACASDTRRAIARTGSLHYVGESKSIRTGKQLIDGALDTQEVAKVRDLPTQLKWDSEEERKVLASYVMEKLKSVDSNAHDASTAELVMLTILQHLMPANKEELAPVKRSVREKVERSLRMGQVFELRDVAHAIKTAQIIGELGAEEDRALERRVVVSARAQLYSTEPSVIAKFIGAKLDFHTEQRKRGAGLLQAKFERSLGYTSKILNGAGLLVRGDPAPGFEELSRHLTRQRGQYFYTTESGERWKVSASYEVGPDIMISLDRVAGGGAVTLRHGGLVQMLKNQTLNKHLHNIAAQSVAETQLGARQILRNHDLTQEGTAYITVTPQRYDIVTAASVTYATLLENVLIRRYGKTLEPIHIVSDSPINQIREAIRDSLRRAPQTKDIFVQLQEHGATDGIGFSPVITAGDLARLSQEFPNVDLHVMTIACFGGGLRPALQYEMQKYPGLKKRLHFYSHTQPEVEAVALGVGGSDYVYDIEMSSTPYMLTLIKKLAEGHVKTFGEAIDQSDHESQKVAPINPETLINGEFLGEVKRQTRSGGHV